jgi:hypothetical protein
MCDAGTNVRLLAGAAAADATSWPQRWNGSLRQRRVKSCGTIPEEGLTSRTCTLEPSSCGQQNKRKRVSRVEKVPVKPPPEAAAARAGPALRVHPRLNVACE